MAIIDELKKKTEEGLKTLKETAQDLAFNVEKQAKIGKRKYVDISKLQRSIHNVYAEIGEYVHDQFTSGRAPSMESPFLKERVSSITRMKLEIRDIEEEIDDIQKTQPPKHDEEP
jgi:dsDNA-specific endonuclease/ATPase MutS2